LSLSNIFHVSLLLLIEMFNHESITYWWLKWKNDKKNWNV